MPVCWRMRAFTLARVGRCGACGAVAMRIRGCRKLDCSTCAGDVARRRARAVVARMGGATAWHAWVLGLPRTVEVDGETANPGWSDALQIDAVKELRKSAGMVLAEWSEAWRGGRSGWVLHVHPCGDSDVPSSDGRHHDSDEWGPHFHALGPCVVVPVGSDVPRPCKRFVAIEALDAMRVAWGRVLETFARERGLPLASSVVHLRVLTRSRQLVQRATYDGRSFPAWSAGEGGKVSKLLRAVWIGGFAPNSRQRWVEHFKCFVELSSGSDEDGLDESAANTCPCCAGRIEWAPTPVLAATLIRGPPNMRATIALSPRPHRSGGPWLSWVPVGACKGAA